jgi:hypothetical protein
MAQDLSIVGIDLAKSVNNRGAFIRRLPTGMRSFLSSATCGIQTSIGARR